MRLAKAGITARQVMTKEAFENAITVVMALGGSTNAVLHLLASPPASTMLSRAAYHAGFDAGR